MSGRVEVLSCTVESPSPAGLLPHLALGLVDVPVGAADGALPVDVPGPRAGGGAGGGGVRAVRAGAVVGELDAAPTK